MLFTFDILFVIPEISKEQKKNKNHALYDADDIFAYAMQTTQFRWERASQMYQRNNNKTENNAWITLPTKHHTDRHDLQWKSIFYQRSPQLHCHFGCFFFLLASRYGCFLLASRYGRFLLASWYGSFLLAPWYGSFLLASIIQHFWYSISSLV